MDQCDPWFAQTLLKYGVDPDSTIDGSSSGDTAMFRAILEDRRDYVDLLLSNGADINNPRSDGETPVMSAALLDNFSLALYLIDRGADLYAYQGGGETLGTWIYFSSTHGTKRVGEEGKALNAIIEKLKEGGYSWPPMNPEQTLSAAAKGTWPPKRKQ